MEKVREYAEEDPKSDGKPRRPLTGYYANRPNIEASTPARLLHSTVNDRERIIKDAEGERYSFPKSRGYSDEMFAEQSKSLENVSVPDEKSLSRSQDALTKVGTS